MLSPHFLQIQIPKKNPERSTRSQCWWWLLDNYFTSYCQWDIQNALQALHVWGLYSNAHWKSLWSHKLGWCMIDTSTCGPLVQMLKCFSTSWQQLCLNQPLCLRVTHSFCPSVPPVLLRGPSSWVLLASTHKWTLSWGPCSSTVALVHSPWPVTMPPWLLSKSLKTTSAS